MKKLLAILALGVLLSACGEHRKDTTVEVRDECINGVTYYRWVYTFAPAFNIDGSLIPCKVE